MTRSEIEQAVYRMLGKSTTPDTTTRDRIRGFVGNRLRDLYALDSAERLRQGTTTITTVAGTAAYDLAVSVVKVLRIVDRANQRVLRSEGLAWYREADPDPQQGTPEAFIWTTLEQASTTTTPHVTVTLWPTPSAVQTLYVDYLAALTDLASDTAIPVLPVDFHELLVDGACADECLHMNDKRAAAFEARYLSREKKLKGWLWSDPSTRLIPGTAHLRGWSSLGPWFPAE